jgi:alkylation response protein AidB-like acyl-CoA dehydrogenase
MGRNAVDSNATFIDDYFVPDEDRLGEEGKGFCIAQHLKGELSPVEAAKVKLIVTDLHNKLVNECLQFFGGYGYMHEYPIARAFIDARITRIAGGAAEVMKQIIGRDLFARNR